MAEASEAAMEGERMQVDEHTDRMQPEGGAGLEVPHGASSGADFFNTLHSAVSARAEYIKENVESLSMLGFRRLLEQDLGMETFSLDSHKKRIKQLVDEVLTVAEVEPETTTTQKEINAEVIRDAIFKRSDYLQSQSESLSFKEVRRLLEQDLGLEEFSLDSKKTLIDQILIEVINNKESGAAPEEEQAEKKQTRAKPGRKVIEESDEEEAEEKKQTKVKPRKKKAQVVDDSEEEGSEQENLAEAHESDEEGSQQKKQSKTKPRKRITQTVDDSDEEGSKEEKQSKAKSNKRKPQVVNESDNEGSEEQKQTEVEEEVNKIDSSEKPQQKQSKAKAGKRKKQESGGGPEEKENEKTPPKKQTKGKAGKKKTQNGEEASEEKEPDASERKPKKRKSDEQQADTSDSSDKRPSKATKAPAAKPLQSKTVEHLKQMIKSSGMNIPPSIYKKVKQTSEDRREDALIKELEAILQKEGLNRNSSEKEIKAVKRRKDKQKDLEGIDLGNIISESRGSRRQNFYDLPFEKKPKKMVISDDEESDDEEQDESE